MPVQAAPIIVEPSGEFLGNDGSWSTFAIEVGVPPQKLQVLASTEAPETLLVLSAGCLAAGDSSNCTEARGGVYNNTKSSGWVSKNIYTLQIEGNLGLTANSDNGQFGYDRFSLSTGQGGNVTLDQQILAGIATKDYFLGTLGLSQTAVNFTDPFDSRPSLITNLKDQSLIPSSSYGYTAGAFYRNNATASLTLGGYDASRFTPNDVSFGLAKEPFRQLVVALETITFSDSSSKEIPLLKNGILTLVDSTVPTIWLPLEVCQAFENAFGISYQPIPNLYIVNDTLHEQMVKRNASVTFTLAQTLGSPTSINITLPYSSFDLEIDSPLVKTKERYFPLRRAADDTQYTLGRTFLQEAYLIVDYENNNFSISQTTFGNTPAHISASQPSNGTASSSSIGSNGGSGFTKTADHSAPGFPVGAIAGIVVAVILIAFVSGFFTARHYKRTHKRKNSMIYNMEELPADPRYPHDKAEADGSRSLDDIPDKKLPYVTTYSVPGSPGIEIGSSTSYMPPMELPGSPPPPSPLPHSPPSRSEAPSPEPYYRLAEMGSPEPSAHELWSTREGITPEMDSPELRSTIMTTTTPSPEVPSALSSPGLVWPRPGMGSRRSGADRLSTSSSTSRPMHDQQDSNDSVSAYTPVHPSHLRHDSNDGDSLITLDRRASQRSGSDPSISPVMQRPTFRQMNSHGETADTVKTRLEGPSMPLVGRRSSARRRESSSLSIAGVAQLGSTTEEGYVEGPPQPLEPYGARLGSGSV